VMVTHVDDDGFLKFRGDRRLGFAGAGGPAHPGAHAQAARSPALSARSRST
jgi:hypothetical protein